MKFNHSVEVFLIVVFGSREVLHIGTIPCFTFRRVSSNNTERPVIQTANLHNARIRNPEQEVVLWGEINITSNGIF